MTQFMPLVTFFSGAATGVLALIIWSMHGADNGRKKERQKSLSQKWTGVKTFRFENEFEVTPDMGDITGKQLTSVIATSMIYHVKDTDLAKMRIEAGAYTVRVGVHANFVKRD